MANITKPSGLSNIWAAAGTKIDPGNSKVGLGWVVQLPPYEYQNWVDNRQDAAIAHINQHGIAEWDAVTEYQGNLSYTQGSNGMIYKCLVTHINKDPINGLNSAFWSLAFESFGSVQVVSDALAVHITNYQTLSAIANPSAARSNLSLYSKAESDTRFAGLNGSSAQVFSVALATQPEHAVRLGQVNSILAQATESNLGVVRLASNGLTESGLDDLTAITPLKASTVYLKKSGNLSGLGNTATARANLGLGSAAVQPDTAFLNTVNNLSDLTNTATARANLGLTSTATQPETYFLRASQNLADLVNVSTARNNLGLQSTAVTPLNTFLLKADNLAGLADTAIARTNLGLGSAAIASDTAFLKTASNLLDVVNKQSARNNLSVYSIDEVRGLTTSSTWRNMAGQRFGGITYTNTSGRPIVVMMYYGAISSTANISIGTTTGVVTLTWNHSGVTTLVYDTGTFYIPPGGTYMCNVTPYAWLELRD